jgi:hypothetical protein
LHFGYLVSFKGFAVIASGQWKRSNLFGSPGSPRKKVAVFAHNDSRAVSERKESKTQEDTVDSRLRGNDSSHRG